MGDYRVNLDIFAGPMDLLLYLVRKEEVDIYDIPISRITDQYLGYVDVLKNFDMDLAGDFLVMAATLMQIKSAMLLPQADPDQVEDEESGNPRAELIRQLLEYKRFKDAANLLEAAALKQKQRHPRSDSIVDKLKGHDEPELDLDQVSIWDLLDAFDRICQATGGATFDVSHIMDDTPIDLYQIEILHRLQDDGPMTFERVFEGRSQRMVVVGLFLAMLELIRDKLVWVDQDEQGGGLFLRALTDEPAEQAVQRAIFESTEMFADEQPVADEAAEEETADDEMVAEEGEFIEAADITEFIESVVVEDELEADVEVVFEGLDAVEQVETDLGEIAVIDEADDAVETVEEAFGSDEAEEVEADTVEIAVVDEADEAVDRDQAELVETLPIAIEELPSKGGRRSKAEEFDVEPAGSVGDESDAKE